MISVVSLGISRTTVAGPQVAFVPVQAQAGTTDIVASGFLEADQLDISSELGGRIVALHLPEGAEVKVGDTLIELDRGIAEAEVGIATAKAQSARATLAQVKAGARTEAVQQAMAAVTLAEVARDATDQASKDAQMLLANQQSLDLQIIQMRTQIEVASHNLAGAKSIQSGAQLVMDRFSVPFKELANWQAWIGVNSAEATYSGAQATLSALEDERSSAHALRAQVDAAETTYNTAVTAVAQARARLADLQAGATPAQIGVALAQVRVADAATTQAKVHKLSIVAPVGGLVSAVNLEAGELSAPGATILTLTDLDVLSLVVYIPADKLGRVTLGAQASVVVDGLAGRSFSGEVVNIGDKAEFVPNNVQSTEDRTSLVYAVKLRLANPITC